MHWAFALVTAAVGVPAGWCVKIAIIRIPGDGNIPRVRRGARQLTAVLLTIAAFAAMGLRFGASPALPAFCFLAAVAIALGYIDARHQRLPDQLTLTAYPVAVAMLGTAALFLPSGPRYLAHALLGAAAAGAFYLLLAVLNPAGLGWGDVKLSGVVGLYLGWLGARALIAGLAGGFALAAVAGITLIAMGKATRKSHLPFGPYMLIAAVGTVLAAPSLTHRASRSARFRMAR